MFYIIWHTHISILNVKSEGGGIFFAINKTSTFLARFIFDYKKKDLYEIEALWK